jgi:putative hydrolase of HD superfamily
MEANRSLLDMLLELERLDRVPRSGFALRGVPDGESVAEHSWHVAVLVWALAPRVPGLDAERATAMALVHDIAEVRLGDLPMTAARYLGAAGKAGAEQAAMRELTAPLGRRAVELLEDYESAGSLEARLVRACDKLQLMLKVALYESSGATGLSEFWVNSDNFPAAGIEAVDALVAELRTRFSAPDI